MYENYGGLSGQENRMQIWQQAKFQQEIFKNQLEIEREAAKVWIKEESKLRVLDRSMKLHQEEEERQRATFEEIAIDRDGNITVITRNLSIQAQPRQVVNMHSPQLFIAERASGKMRKALILRCRVGEDEKLIFLDAKKIESGAYLLGKFAEAGVSVLATSARAKDYMKQLLALLVRNGVAVDIPEETGWMLTDEGKFLFADERRITWRKIMEKI